MLHVCHDHKLINGKSLLGTHSKILTINAVRDGGTQGCGPLLVNDTFTLSEFHSMSTDYIILRRVLKLSFQGCLGGSVD